MDFFNMAGLMHSVSISASLKFAILPIAKVLAMCGLGFFLATERIGLLTPGRTKLLSQLVFTVFLPCLIFSQLGSAITLQEMLQWWFIPANIVIASGLGCLIGFIVVWIVKPPPQFKKFTIVAVGIGNIGNIPLVLMDALCRDTSNPFGEYATCSEEGVAYISYGQWVGAVIVYTFVYYMLSPPVEIEYSGTSDVAGHSALTIHLLDTKEGKEEEQTLKKRFSLWKKQVIQAVEGMQALERLKQILQPPVVASILALIVGAIPFLKSMFWNEGSPVYFITDSISIMGSAMIPCILLSLGGSLVGGPRTSELGLRTTIAIVFVRLFIVPCMGTGVVLLAKRLGFLVDGDYLYEFVLLLQHSMPSSILAGSVAVMRGVAVKESAANLFYQHILSVVSVTFWLVVYLNILF